MNVNQKIALGAVICGVILIELGAGIALGAALRPRSFVRTRGRIVSLGGVDVRNHVEPVVEFEMDGKRVQGRCNNVSLNTFRGKIGDEVEISYGTQTVMGVRTLKVYLDSTGRAGQRDRLWTILGGLVFVIAGIAMIVYGRHFAPR